MKTISPNLLDDPKKLKMILAASGMIHLVSGGVHSMRLKKWWDERKSGEVSEVSEVSEGESSDLGK